MITHFMTLVLSQMILTGLAAFNRAYDSADSYYLIGHVEFAKTSQEKIPTKCYIQKVQNGKQTWKMTYDTTDAYCQGYGIFYQNGNLYALFKIAEPKSDAGSLRNNVETDAPTAFKAGLWSDPGNMKNTIDVIANIDTEDGKMLTATYLFSKYAPSLINTASYSMHVSGLSFEKESIRLTTKS